VIHGPCNLSIFGRDTDTGVDIKDTGDKLAKGPFMTSFWLSIPVIGFASWEATCPPGNEEDRDFVTPVFFLNLRPSQFDSRLSEALTQGPYWRD